MKFSIALILFFSALISYGQSTKEITLRFLPTYNHQQIIPEQQYFKLNSGDSLQLDEIKCYISGISFYKNEKLIFAEPNSYYLLDAATANSLLLKIIVPADLSFNAIGFNLGIDSTTNVSGVMGGNLDPVNGMYWTWQSGYINAKLSGVSNLCNTRNNNFQFHLGGYAGKNNSLQKILLPVVVLQNEITVEMQLDKFFNEIELAKNNDVTIPCTEAVRLSKILSTTFSVLAK